MFRRSKHLMGMSYTQRQEYRAKQKAAKVSQGEAWKETLNRLSSFIQVIDAAFKPEADAYHERVLAYWDNAYNNVRKAKGDEEAIYFIVTGVSLTEDEQSTYYVHKGQPGRAEYEKSEQLRQNRKSKWQNSPEKTVLDYCFRAKQPYNTFRMKQADDAVAYAKGKLHENVAKKFGEINTIEVTNYNVYTNVKGFEGRFFLLTDKGPRIFDCKAIPVDGVQKIFHFRYVAYLKEGRK